MYLDEKRQAIEKTGLIIASYQPNVDSVHYEVFDTTDGYRCEYLIINYDGGAKTVRNCRGNSYSAILEELTRYLEHGYYGEISNYEEEKSRSVRMRLTDNEFNIISRLTHNTKLDTDFDIIAIDDNYDGFYERDSLKTVYLTEGLQWLWDGLAYPGQHDGLSPEEARVVAKLFLEYGIISPEEAERYATDLE